MNLETLDYAGKRLALNASRVQAQVWATDHTPRWHATMHLGGDGPLAFLDTTNRGCTRCSRWRIRAVRTVHRPGDGPDSLSGSCTRERLLVAAPAQVESQPTVTDHPPS